MTMRRRNNEEDDRMRMKMRMMTKKKRMRMKMRMMRLVGAAMVISSTESNAQKPQVCVWEYSRTGN